MRKIVLVALLCYCLVLTEDVCDDDLLHCYGSCVSLWPQGTHSGVDECKTPDSNTTDGKCTECLNWNNNDVDVCSWNCSNFGEFCEYCTNEACSRCLTQEHFDDDIANCSIPQNCSAIKGDGMRAPYVALFCANPSLLNPALHCMVDIEDATKCIAYKEYTCDPFTEIKGPNHCHQCKGYWDDPNDKCYDCTKPSTLPNEDICKTRCGKYWNSTESTCHGCDEPLITESFCTFCHEYWIVDEEDEEDEGSCHPCKDALTMHDEAFCEQPLCQFYWIEGATVEEEGTCHDCSDVKTTKDAGYCEHCAGWHWVGDNETGSCHQCEDAVALDDRLFCVACTYYWIGEDEDEDEGTCHDCSDVKTTKDKGYCESCTEWHWVGDEQTGSCHKCEEALTMNNATFCNTTCEYFWLEGEEEGEGTCHDCSDVKNVDDKPFCDWCETNKTYQLYHWIVEDESGSCHDCNDPVTVFDEILCGRCGFYWDSVGKACHDCNDVNETTNPAYCHWCNHYKASDANWATDKCGRCTDVDDNAVTCTNDTIDSCYGEYKVSGDKKSCYFPMINCLEPVGETMCFLCENGKKPSQMGTSNCHVCPYCGDDILDDGEECDGVSYCGSDCKCQDDFMKATGNACKPKCNARCAQDCTEPYKCTNCTSPYTGEKCDSCIAGYYDSTPPVNSSSSDSGAAEDVSEHIPTCTKCMEHCIECSVAATCTKCDPAYNLAEGKCVAKPASSTGASMLSFFYFLIFFWFM